MALARPLPPLWQSLMPALNGPVRPVVNLPLLQRLSQPFRSIPMPFAALALPSLSFPSIPSLGDIWEGILKAVPKKKTSYSKKRSRFMAGKALKDLTSLNKCSGCGRVKRAHILCPYCVFTIKSKIFGMTDWRAPKQKHIRQAKYEEIVKRRRERTTDPDPKEEKEKDLLGPLKWHTTKARKQDDGWWER
ncbi:hypothetical protein BDV96DRAFT_611512 [Lophiotrema nucula]|uniref:Large ribosomal subunit protein bL32m n=1 Tax=Lophiotrema nucula TaxID=690887 RepID=A0A6A5ZHK1_9PLEO|nr:hypothetical protein BDV96DRAFT_611512 [Lophiotrema nucula]